MQGRATKNGLGALAVSALGACVMQGCVASHQRPFTITQVIEDRREVTTIAPTGPLAAGGPLRPHQVVVEAGGSIDPVAPGSNARSAGAPGNMHTVAAGAVRAMGRVGASPIEFGGSVDFAAQGTSAPGFADGSAYTNSEQHGVGRASLLMRASAGGERAGFGFNVEGGVGVSELRTTTDAQHTVRYTDNGETRFTRGVYSWGRPVVLGDARAGLFGYARPVQRLTLSLGLLGQLVPMMQGYSRSERTCTGTGSAPETSCHVGLWIDSVLTRHEAPVEIAGLFTVWAAVGVDLGPLELYAQGFVHPVGAGELASVVRGGAQLGLRLSIDTRGPVRLGH